MSPTEEKLIDEKFKGVISAIESLKENTDFKLNTLIGHVERTNGTVISLNKRVSDVEKTQYTCGIKTIGENIKKIEIEVARLANETSVVRFYQRYPKLMITTIVLVAGSGLIQIIGIALKYLHL